MNSSHALLLGVLLMGLGCDFEVESDRPCTLTSDGWECAPDQGDLPDAGEAPPDVTTFPDDGPLPERDAADPEPDLSDDASDTSDASDPLPEACRDLMGSDNPTGQYTLETPEGTVEVHCDMNIDNGGWTLVARSVAGGDSPQFGWRVEAGSLDDLTSPYAAGLTHLEISEILVATHEGDLTPGARAYRLSGFGDLFEDCSSNACATNLDVVEGPCTETVMLNFTGLAQESSRFFFRDLEESVGSNGLFPDGFSLFYDDCQAGDLHEQQGLIFVR